MPPGGAARRLRRVSGHFYHWLWAGVDLLLPPTCGGCGRAGYRWCPVCQGEVSCVPEPICCICGTALEGLTFTTCADCRRLPPDYASLRSWSAFDGPVRNALHRLKYRRDVGLGEALALPLARFACDLAWPIDLVVPVPLGARRLKERGYNQSALIAWPLAMALGLKYDHDAVARVRDSRSQVGLARSERQENVRDAFRAQSARVGGRSVLLVDDVATTGSTLSSCAAALRASGAQDVFALTVARALPRHGLASV